jgi:hypothetical protein
MNGAEKGSERNGKAAAVAVVSRVAFSFFSFVSLAQSLSKPVSLKPKLNAKSHKDSYHAKPADSTS